MAKGSPDKSPSVSSEQDRSLVLRALANDQTADFYPWGMADPVVFNISNASGDMAVNLMPTSIVEVH